MNKLSHFLKEEPSNSGPQMIPLNLIDEDTSQPRREDNPGFSESSIAELAATIQERGVKSPISVRINPTDNDRYIINHGARRFRASKAAGFDSIPAFIDEDYSAVDQIIENLHRDALTPREIAVFLERLKGEGKKGTEIAAQLGKSTAWVSQYSTLLKLPDWLDEAFQSGKIANVTFINDILKFTKKNAPLEKEVKEWIETEEADSITPANFKTLCDVLLDDAKSQNNSQEIAGDNLAHHDFSLDAQDIQEGEESSEGFKEEIVSEPEATLYPEAPISSSGAHEKEEDNSKFKKAILFGKYKDRILRLILNVRPSTYGLIVVKYEDSGDEAEVPIGDIQLTDITES